MSGHRGHNQGKQGGYGGDRAPRSGIPTVTCQNTRRTQLQGLWAALSAGISVGKDCKSSVAKAANVYDAEICQCSVLLFRMG